MIKRSFSPLAVAALCSLSFAAVTHAASVASDNASNYTTATWITGSNNGTGFLPWNLSATAGGNAGQFIGSSTQLATTGTTNTGANIDTTSTANTTPSSFGMYGQTANTYYNAYRGFSGGALSVGQTFSISIAVNFRNGFKGLDLQSGGAGGTTGTTIFNFNVGGDDYTVGGGATPSGSIGNTYDANTAFRIALTQTSATGGTWTIIRSGGTADRDTGTYTGDPDTFHLYVGTTDAGASNNLYANSLSVTNAVPEPGTWVTVIGGASLLGYTLRRRVVRA